MAQGGHIRAEEPKNELQFNCPSEMVPHLKKVLEGEYDIPLTEADVENEPLTVLDIGANCGAFTVFAKLKWPNCHVTAYEPLFANYTFFRFNTQRLVHVTSYMAAVGDPDRNKLYFG